MSSNAQSDLFRHGHTTLFRTLQVDPVLDAFFEQAVESQHPFRHLVSPHIQFSVKIGSECFVWAMHIAVGVGAPLLAQAADG